jgi:hypothetical protein
MKNSNDSIGNRTHNLPACSAMPQPCLNILSGMLSSGLFGEISVQNFMFRFYFLPVLCPSHLTVLSKFCYIVSFSPLLM